MKFSLLQSFWKKGNNYAFIIKVSEATSYCPILARARISDRSEKCILIINKWIHGFHGLFS